jgi:hypothetical protein
MRSRTQATRAAIGHAQHAERRVRFVLFGLPTLSLNLKRARTYAERMFRHVVVGNLDRGDPWDALALPLTAAGRSFSLDVVADIIEATAGYPYFLQFFGAYPCRSVATADVSVDDYRALEPALLHELDLAFFEDRFEGASPTEQRVLEAMGRNHGQVRIGTLRQQLADLPGLDLLVRRLIDRGFVYRVGRGAYDFALPLFRDYLWRRPKLTELTRSIRRGASGAREGER